MNRFYSNLNQMFQHTAARRRLKLAPFIFTTAGVSTHSRPKAAGSKRGIPAAIKLFQHTAARRRLFLI